MIPIPKKSATILLVIGLLAVILFVGFSSPLSLVNHNAQIQVAGGTFGGEYVGLGSGLLSQNVPDVLNAGDLYPFAGSVQATVIPTTTAPTVQLSYNSMWIVTSASGVDYQTTVQKPPTIVKGDVKTGSAATVDEISASITMPVAVTQDIIVTMKLYALYNTEIWLNGVKSTSVSHPIVLSTATVKVKYQAPAPELKIDLKVYTNAGTVYISVTGSGYAQQKWSTTDPTTFHELSYGTYTVTMTREGYHSQSQTIQLSGTANVVTAATWQSSTTPSPEPDSKGDLVVKTDTSTLTTITIQCQNPWYRRSDVPTYGQNTFSGIPAGIYDIWITRADYKTQYATATVYNGQSTTYTAAEWVPLVTPTPEPEPGAFGTVLVNTGLKEDGSTVTITIKNVLWETVSTTTEGSFTINNVPQGQYTITLARDGYTTQSGNIAVFGDDTTTFIAKNWDDGGDEYAWSFYGYLTAIGGIIIGVMVFAFAPIPPKFKAFIALAIALAGLVAAHMFNIGGI